MIKKETFVIWLRWILVLPIAIVSYLAIQFIVAIGNSMFFPGPEWLVNMYCQFINSVVGPYCLVVSGAITAPKYRFVVAVAITIVFAVVTGSLITLAMVSNRHSDPLWWLFTTSLISLIAAIAACIKFNKEEIKPLTVKEIF